jgi:hypothetical protein
LFNVRHAASSGTSIKPPIRSAACGVMLSQSHPRRITLPKVLIAIPRWSSGSALSARNK